MDKKTSAYLHYISISLFCIMFLIGAGGLAYFNFISSTEIPLERQTIAWLIATGGPLGVLSEIKALSGGRVSPGISFGILAFALVSCVLWLAFIYFITDLDKDAFTYAAAWIMTAGCTSSFIKNVTGKR